MYRTSKILYGAVTQNTIDNFTDVRTSDLRLLTVILGMNGVKPYWYILTSLHMFGETQKQQEKPLWLAACLTGFQIH